MLQLVGAAGADGADGEALGEAEGDASAEGDGVVVASGARWCRSVLAATGTPATTTSVAAAAATLRYTTRTRLRRRPSCIACPMSTVDGRDSGSSKRASNTLTFSS